MSRFRKKPVEIEAVQFTPLISPKTALLLDTERLGKIAVAVDLFRQASEARRTAVLLAEIGCTGSAADCRVLGHDLDKRAGEVLGAKS